MDFKHRNGTRICPTCGTILKRNGHTKSGTQRWYCKKCKKSFMPNKKLIDVITRKSKLKLLIDYLLNTKPIQEFGLNRMQFLRLTREFRNIRINPLCDFYTYSKVIYLDAIYFSNACCMIARNNEKVIGGGFCEKECSHEGFMFIRNFPQPEFVVCDGGPGLISAIKQAGPKVKHQRCLFHVGLNIKTKLTLRPETKAGYELLNLGKELLNINSIEQRDQGITKGKEWYFNYKEFISTKSVNDLTGEIWFTHKELRSASGNLGKLILENNLFYYLEDSDVSKTNNYLEGGINSRLKQLLYFHRGCSFAAKRKLIEFYLLKRSNFYSSVIRMLYTKKIK